MKAKERGLAIMLMSRYFPFFVFPINYMCAYMYLSAMCLFAVKSAT